MWLDALGAALVSLAYGLVSGVVPVFNAEAWVAAARVSGVAAVLPVAVGLGIGVGLGKVAVVLAVRGVLDWRWLRGPRREAASPADQTSEPTAPPGPTKRAARLWSWVRWSLDRLTALVEHPVLGPVVVVVSAATSVPPVYPVTIVAAASRMRLWVFALACCGGLVARFLVVGVGVGLLVDLVSP